jgi:predicted DCC family thiol-disulfide oxidoreductase YuxK
MKKIIFFDSKCTHCNSFIHFLFKYDKREVFYFSDYQSELAKSYIKKNIDSVIYFNGVSTLTKSEAIQEILRELNGLSIFIAKVMSFFPRSFLNFGYDFFARNRHRFSQKKACRLFSENERARFI